MKQLLFYNQEAGEVATRRLNLVLHDLIEQFNYNKAAEVFDQKEKITFQEISNLNNKRFLLPVLMKPQLKDAVYFNFNEFVNDVPSITAFGEKKIRYMGLRNEEALVNKNDSTISNYWAYRYKGQTKISRFGNEKIYRLGNTFEYFVKVRVPVPRSTGQIVVINYNEFWVPYQLDMETGTFY